jgi:hypothetical protein
LAKPPKQVQRDLIARAKDAGKSRQAHRQNASTKTRERERLAAATKAASLTLCG